MFLTVHATAGAAVGALTGNPILGFLFGVISHFTLDIIPHGDENLAPPCAGATCTHREEVRFLIRLACVDGVIMLGVLAWLLMPWVTLPTWSVLAGIVGGVLPDVGQGLGALLPRVRPLAEFKRIHDWIHVDIIRFETPFALGMVTQFAALSFFIGVFRVLL
ncbi:MAG: hypothetical protein Q7S96_00735 [bacterium]|nr:hypothetical protein [bacterium]